MYEHELTLQQRIDRGLLTPQKMEIAKTAPKREDYPHADDEEWEEIVAGWRHRTAHILRPPHRNLVDPSDLTKDL